MDGSGEEDGFVGGRRRRRSVGDLGSLDMKCLEFRCQARLGNGGSERLCR